MKNRRKDLESNPPLSERKHDPPETLLTGQERLVSLLARFLWLTWRDQGSGRTIPPDSFADRSASSP